MLVTRVLSHGSLFWSLVQRSPTECDRGASCRWPRPTMGVEPWKKKKNQNINALWDFLLRGRTKCLALTGSTKQQYSNKSKFGQRYIEGCSSTVSHLWPYCCATKCWSLMVDSSTGQVGCVEFPSITVRCHSPSGISWNLRTLYHAQFETVSCKSGRKCSCAI